MGFLNNVIAGIAPGYAAKRELNRLRLNFLKEQGRKYEAASKGRRTTNWVTQSKSANHIIRESLPILRERSRQLFMDNAYAKRAIQIISSNTVGTGIRPSPQFAGKAQADKMKALWKYWAEKKRCDFDGVFDFYGLQLLVMKTVVMSGECIVLKRRTKDLKVPIKLQVLEGDYIDSDKDSWGATDGNGEYMVQGVVFGPGGVRKGYWLFDKHPSERGVGTSKFYEAADVVHVYRVERPGQVRGVPFGTSSMLRIKDFDDYEDAELIRQKIAACYAIFVTDPQGDGQLTEGEKEEAAKVEPGMIEYLPAGKQVTMASPPATQNYDEYSTKILQGVAMGYDVTYESLTGDLSKVNFSSARMGWLEFHRILNEYQRYMVIPMFCERVYSWFLEGAAVALNYNGDLELDVAWTAPRREMINPAEELKAMETAVRNGFMSWQEVIRQSGYEPQALIAEIKEDYDLFDKNGFMLACDPRHDVNRQQAQEGSAQDAKNKAKEAGKK